ncbi:MAG: tripartite tricarboxylate transporter TctB family protein [Eubacteriales bacterium]
MIDLFSGFTITLIGAYLFYITLNFPLLERKYPQILTSILVIFGLLLIIKSFMKGEKDFIISFRTLYDKNKVVILRIFLFVSALTIYVLMMPILGFITSTIVFLLLSLFICGMKNYVSIVILSILIGFLFYFVFAFAFNVRLPRGVLEYILESMFW